jgi:hypothetical protein
LARDAEWPRRSTWKCVLKFVTPTGVIKKVRCDKRKIDIARFFDRFAAVHRFEHGELTRFLLNQTRDAVEIFAALAPGHFSPNAIESAPRRFYRKIDIARSAVRDLCQSFLSCGIDRIEIFPGTRFHELSADEKLVFRFELDVAVRFRRRRIIPTIAKI